MYITAGGAKYYVGRKTVPEGWYIMAEGHANCVICAAYSRKRRT